MSLSTAEIQSVVRQLAGGLTGGRIERIDQPDRWRLILTVRNGPALYWLLLCAHPRFSRIHLMTTRPEQARPAAGFCNVARQHLTGAPIEEIWQAPDDRIVVFRSRERDKLMRAHPVRLVAELVGVGSNMLLVDESDRVLGALIGEDSGRRRIFPGAHYEMPERPERVPDRARRNRFEDSVDPLDPLSLSRAIQGYYAPLEAEEDLESARADIAKALRRELKRDRGRLEKVSEELRRAEQAESWRRKGELLKIALPRLQRGQKELVVEDLFDPDRPKLTIELDAALSPAENLQRLFHRYKKARHSVEKLEARLRSTQEAIETLEGLLRRAEEADSIERLEDLKGRLREVGLRLPRERLERAPMQKGGPRIFQSADGLDILVGRSDKGNRRLTFTIARGNDYWLHVRGWPGPHVVLRKPPAGELPQESLLDAAHLAVHFSKIRDADYAEVDYTQCKYVRQLKGAAPGKVGLARASTFQVRIEPDRLRRLLEG
ncbi:MAG: NFACT family protein [Planctomycetes bacterium]|nr:NFACT family protein [Planctomycetota bacterium]